MTLIRYVLTMYRQRARKVWHFFVCFVPLTLPARFVRSFLARRRKPRISFCCFSRRVSAGAFLFNQVVAVAVPRVRWATGLGSIFCLVPLLLDRLACHGSGHRLTTRPGMTSMVWWREPSSTGDGPSFTTPYRTSSETCVRSQIFPLLSYSGSLDSQRFCCIGVYLHWQRCLFLLFT
jgi:hypothetical protein